MYIYICLYGFDQETWMQVQSLNPKLEARNPRLENPTLQNQKPEIQTSRHEALKPKLIPGGLGQNPQKKE